MESLLEFPSIFEAQSNPNGPIKPLFGEINPNMTCDTEFELNLVKALFKIFKNKIWVKESSQNRNQISKLMVAEDFQTIHKLFVE